MTKTIAGTTRKMVFWAFLQIAFILSPLFGVFWFGWAEFMQNWQLVMFLSLCVSVAIHALIQVRVREREMLGGLLNKLTMTVVAHYLLAFAVAASTHADMQLTYVPSLLLGLFVGLYAVSMEPHE